MRHVLALAILLVILPGCGSNEESSGARQTIALDELAVTVRDHPRSYFHSDRRGGFLVGSAGQGVESRAEWSVDGQILLRGLVRLEMDGKPVDQAAIDSVRVTPLEVVRFFRDGLVETTTLLDQVLGEEEAHAFAVQVQTLSSRDISFAILPGEGFIPAPQRDTRSLLFRKAQDGSLAFSAGAQGEITPSGITVRQASRATCVVAFSPGDSADYLAQRAQGEVDLLRLARRERMEKLLQRAYFQASDQELTRGLRWLQLSLDAMTIVSSETTAVAALPWDGSLSVRDNAIAVAGLDVAIGDYAVTGGMLRSIARHEDVSADGRAWFTREAYEHVIASGDTALVRDIYPTVVADIARMQRAADLFNFLPLTNGSARGTRAADQQGLWFFQQTIGSIFAMYLGDTSRAAHWALMADLTSSAFNRMFIDTARSMLYDRIAPNGRGSLGSGPGTLLCLDMIESEAVRQNTVKSVMKTGLRTLGIAMPGEAGDAASNTAIQNWMAGQMVYALTRYDCQHVSYPVTRRLTNRILTSDMIGVLPEMYESNGEGRALGAQASLAAMAEFVRSFHQDYLGVHVNMTTRSLALEPKLPDEIGSVKFTIFAGEHPVSARYERMGEGDHVVLRGEELADSLRVTFLWMMKNGNAWRGATALHPGVTTTLIFGEHEATVLFDGKNASIERARRLVGFSQRAAMEEAEEPR
jgi:hypothetical protein